VASDLLSLFATSNNINELISNSNIDNDVYNSISFDQELRDMSITLSKFSSETKDVDNQIERLSKLLSDMDSILNHLNVINEELLEYCAKLPEH
jgi:archaellum component FlaC